jgi:hypothetical protein
MSEGKYHEGKGRDEDDRSRHDVMEVVQEFCMSDEFEKEFEMFAKEHSDVFTKSLEFSVHSNEHPIEFHNVYLLYLKKFEGMIEEFIMKVNVFQICFVLSNSYFIIKSGFTIRDFYQKCREILESDEIFGRKRFFIETMLAISEYENFFLLMQAEMKLNQQASRK